MATAIPSRTAPPVRKNSTVERGLDFVKIKEDLTSGTERTRAFLLQVPVYLVFLYLVYLCISIYLDFMSVVFIV